jgi:hypothetical protein
VDPRDREITHIAGVDLVEQAIVIGFVGSVIGQPIIRTTRIDQRRVDRLSDCRRRTDRHTGHQDDHPGDTHGFSEHRFPPP